MQRGTKEGQINPKRVQRGNRERPKGDKRGTKEGPERDQRGARKGPKQDQRKTKNCDLFLPVISQQYSLF